MTSHADLRLADQLRAAEAELAGGDLERAAAHARELMGWAEDDALHADAVGVLAGAEMRAGRAEDALALLTGEARRVEALEPRRASALRAAAANLHFLRLEANAALEMLYAARDVAGGTPAPFVLGGIAIAETLLARPGVDELLDANVAAMRLDGDYSLAGPMAWHLVVRERLVDAEALVEDALGRLDPRAAPGAVALLLRARAEAALHRGDWAHARAHALEALGLHRAAGHQSAAALALVQLARLDASEGRFDACDERVAEALTFSQAAGADGITAAGRAALGLAALGREDGAASALLLDQVAARLRAGGLVEPNWIPFAGDHVEALLLADRRADAADALEELAPRAAASGRCYGTAMVWRARGLLADDIGSAEAAFQRSLAELAPSGRPFERARTQLAFGERLRRARRRGEARALLRPALATFERLGAIPWAERARRELRLSDAASSRAPGRTDEALTEQERRTALLAAEGHTNNEIAAALTVTAKTVEFHLGNAYRKLGIRRRTEIARALDG